MQSTQENLIERCKTISQNIQDYFEEERYITEVEQIEEITPDYLVRRAIGLVQDELEEIGIQSNFSVDDLVCSSVDLETMFHLRTKFDRINYYKLLRNLDDKMISEYMGIVENIELAEDFLIEIANYFAGLFPQDIGWNYVDRAGEFWYSTKEFVAHLVAIHARLNSGEDFNKTFIDETNIAETQVFLEKMAARDQEITLYANYICDHFQMVNREKLMTLIKKYDKDKLNPDEFAYFVEYNRHHEEGDEPPFLQAHHKRNVHHIEYWEYMTKVKSDNIKPFTFEVACMAVFSLVLDRLSPEKFSKEVDRFFPYASKEIIDFMSKIKELNFSELRGGKA